MSPCLARRQIAGPLSVVAHSALRPSSPSPSLPAITARRGSSFPWSPRPPPGYPDAVKIRHAPWDPPFPVRLELRPDGAVLVGQEGKRRVEVRPRYVRLFCLADATDAE